MTFFRLLTIRVLARLFWGESIRALLRQKVRTSLTALGIMVGVAAVIWVVAIGRAGTARAEAELAKLGDNLVWVEAGSRNVAGVRTGSPPPLPTTGFPAQGGERRSIDWDVSMASTRSSP